MEKRVWAMKNTVVLLNYVISILDLFKILAYYISCMDGIDRMSWTDPRMSIEYIYIYSVSRYGWDELDWSKDEY